MERTATNATICWFLCKHTYIIGAQYMHSTQAYSSCIHTCTHTFSSDSRSFTLSHIVVYVAGRRRCCRSFVRSCVCVCACIVLYIYTPKRFRAHILALMPNTRRVQSHSHCIQRPFVYVHVRVSHSQFVILYLSISLSIKFM